MPQMAPLNWMILYIMFSVLFLVINFMNYYMFLIENKMESNKNIKKSIYNWKW